MFYNETGQCTAALVDGKMLFPDTPFTVTTGQWSSTQKGFIYGSKGLNRFSGRVYGNADGRIFTLQGIGGKGWLFSGRNAMMESTEKKETGRRTTMEDRTLLDFLAQAEKLKCTESNVIKLNQI